AEHRQRLRQALARRAGVASLGPDEPKGQEGIPRATVVVDPLETVEGLPVEGMCAVARSAEMLDPRLAIDGPGGAGRVTGALAVRSGFAIQLDGPGVVTGVERHAGEIGQGTKACLFGSQLPPDLDR